MRRLFAETRLREHPDDYVIVSIDPVEGERARGLTSGISPFGSLTFDRDEVSLVLKSGEWEGLKDDFDKFQVAGPYRLITFDIVLDLSIVGFLAVVSAALAEEGVSIYALSTYLRDHILVKKEDAPKAVGALQRIIEDSRRG